jgi:DNA-directed RNA polymerase specialized sigma24 family protein
MRMTRPEDEIRPLPDASPADGGRVYEEYRDLLLEMLTRTFGVPAQDAETLVYETVMAYQMAEYGPALPSFLIAGARAKGQAWQEAHGGARVKPDPDAALARGALHLLAGNAREAVRLRFEEGMAYPDIAMELGMTVFAAEQLVAKALAKIRRLQRA